MVDRQQRCAAMRKLRVLDLFSGTGSVSKACADRPEEFDVYSLDITDKFHSPTCKQDILEWDCMQFAPGHFDIIMASPPCKAYLQKCYSSKDFVLKAKNGLEGTHYSIARTKAKTPRDIIGANKIAQRVLDIIAYYEPFVATIENPATGGLRWQPFMQGLTVHTVTYCMYSDFGYRK